MAGQIPYRCDITARAAKCLLGAVLPIVASCVARLELPDPPDLSPLAEAYASPTASLGQDTVDAAIHRYQDRLQFYDRVGGISALLGGVTDLQESISADNSGGVAINSVPVAADAVLRLSGPCANAAAKAAGETGQFDLQAIVHKSQLVPVIWGEVGSCVVQQSIGQRKIKAEFSGQIAMFFPAASRFGSSLLETVIVRFAFDDVFFQGETQGSQRGHFRIQKGRVDFLLELGDQGTVLASTTTSIDQVRLQGRNQVLLCGVTTKMCGEGK